RPRYGHSIAGLYSRRELARSRYALSRKALFGEENEKQRCDDRAHSAGGTGNVPIAPAAQTPAREYPDGDGTLCSPVRRTLRVGPLGSPGKTDRLPIAAAKKHSHPSRRSCSWILRRPKRVSERRHRPGRWSTASKAWGLLA